MTGEWVSATSTWHRRLHCPGALRLCLGSVGSQRLHCKDEIDCKRANMSMKIPRHLLQHVCIWFCVRMCVTPKDTVDAVKVAFGHGAYSRTSVYDWHKAFRSGRTKLGDLIKPGAPQRACTRHRIRHCKVLVEQKKNICVEELSQTLGISQGSTHRILCKDLNMRKRSAKLVPYTLTAAHQRQCWFFCQDFLRKVRRVPQFLSWLVTTDEAWLYLIETCTKQENMQWLTP